VVEATQVLLSEASRHYFRLAPRQSGAS